MTAESSPFPSLSALRNIHRDLLAQRRQGVDNAFLEAVAHFIEQGCATGRLLELDDERWEAQNLLDYWSNELFHNERVPPDATLVEFDASAAPDLPDDQCPYLGLDAFHSSDQIYFFGRDDVIGQMVDMLENGRFLAIVGPSGSGKSSTALAGLLPQLQTGANPNSKNWTYLPPLMPGAHPLENLAHLLKQPPETAATMTENFIDDPNYLAKRLNQLTDKGALLVIDQFEELYTLCRHDHHRHGFIDNLLGVLQKKENRHTIIMTMRSDLESNLMRTAVFQSYYARFQVRLPPMGAVQLRATIEKPARLAGLHFEEGLIDQLIRDVLGEPSALPLLQFTLLKLWENRTKNRITWAAYQQLGGGRQALANSADNFFNKLPAADRPVTRKILLQLIQFGLGPDVTRDRILMHELYKITAEKSHINKLLDQLITARLVRLILGISPDEDKVELAHEALLTHWPRLVAWLEETRVTRRRRLQLSAMAQQWESLNHDPSTLLRGVLLEEAQQYDDLDETESAFVEAGIHEHHREASERDRQQKRELAQAEALANEQQLRLVEKERLTQWLSSAAIALAIVFAVAVVAGLLAAQNADTTSNNAMTAVASEATAVGNEAVADRLRKTAVANAAQLATAEADARIERDQATANEQLARMAQETAVASFLAANDARATAEASAQEAEIQFRLATARELANEALEQLTSNPQLSLLLSMESAYFPLAAAQNPPIETADVLYRALLAAQRLRTLSGHTDWVNDVAVSPDGQWIATAGQDESVRIWQASTGQEHHQIDAHTGSVNGVAFSRDGTRLATAGDDGFVFVWDTADYRLLAALPGENNGAVQAVSFHPDSRRLAAVYEDTSVRIWDTTARQSLVRLLGHTKIVNDVAFTADGMRFATAGADGSVIVWNSETGSPLFSLERSTDETTIGANAVAFHPDGVRIAVAYDDGISRLWEGQTVIHNLPGHTSFVFDVTFSNDGRLIATAGGDGTVKVWHTDTGRVAYIIAGHNGGITAIQFMPDDSQLVTAGRDNSAKIWQGAPGITPIVLTGHMAAVLNATYSNDGAWVATTGEDRTALVWDSRTGEIVSVFAQHNRAVNDAAFSPDNTLLATASEDANVRLWNLESGTAQFLSHPEAVNALAFNPDGTHLATAGDDGMARIWDVATRRIISRFPHDGAVRDLAYHPDGTLLATGDDLGNWHIWELETGNETVNRAGHTGPIQKIAIHPNGSLIATAGNDGTTRLWTLEGELLRTFMGHNGPVTGVAFHPNGSLMATTGADRTVKLWDIDSGLNTRTYLGHTSTVTAVAFSPDGRHIITTSIDRTAQINPLWTIAELFERAWQQTDAPISDELCRRYLHGQPCITTQIPGPLPAAIRSATP